MIATPSNPSLASNAGPASTADTASMNQHDAQLPAAQGFDSDSSLLPHPSSFPDSLLEALTLPNADLPALAAAHNLTLPALARWLREPAVAEALDALLDLFALQRKLWQDHVSKETVDALRETLRTTEDPAERRRLGAHILRALSSNGSRGSNGARGASQGQRARRASEGQGARSASEGPIAGPTPPVPLRNAEGVARVFEGRGRCVSDVADIEPGAPPTEHSAPSTEHYSDLDPQDRPEGWWNSAPPPPADPDSTADLLISRLQAAGPDATVHTVLDIVEGPTLETEEGATIFKAAFAQLASALDGAVVTSTPAEREPDHLHALKRYTFTNPEGAPDNQAHLDFAIRLYCPNGAAWWLEEIIPPDTS